MEEILTPKSYYKSGWIIGSMDPYITLKKKQTNMTCDPRLAVKSPLIYKIAENFLLASAVNYG